MANLSILYISKQRIKEMKLSQNAIGNIPANYPVVWFRVSTWAADTFVADYTTESEAKKASYASTTAAGLITKFLQCAGQEYKNGTGE